MNHISYGEPFDFNNLGNCTGQRTPVVEGKTQVPALTPGVGGDAQIVVANAASDLLQKAADRDIVSPCFRVNKWSVQTLLHEWGRDKG
jgi:hypothetical protein